MELKRYIEIFWRRRRLIVLTISIMAGCPMLAYFIMSPIYSVSARLLINPENIQPGFFSQSPVQQFPNNFGKVSYLEARDVIDTYMTMAKGSPLINKIINDLDIRDRKGRLLGVKDFIVTIPRLPKFIFWQKKGLKITRMQAAEIIEFTGYSTDRDEAAKIANLVANTFTDFLVKLSKNDAVNVRKVLEKEIVKIEKKKEQAEEEEQRFRVRENIINIDNQINTLISERSKLEDEKNMIQRSLQEFRSMVDAITETLRKNQTSINLNGLGSSSNLVQYKNDLLSLEISLARSLSELKHEHPSVVSIEKQIESVKKNISDEISRILRLESTDFYTDLLARYVSGEINTVINTARLKVVTEQIEWKNKEINEIPEKTKELNRLKNTAQSYLSIYESLRNRLEYVKFAQKLNISNAVTVQTASPSTYPRKDIYFPRKTLILVTSLMLGTGFALFLAFLVDYLDDSIKTVKDVKERIGNPLLGVVPLVKGGVPNNNERPALKRDFYNKFWDIKSNVKRIVQQDGNKQLLVTSALSSEGKSVICRYLAKTLVESGQKTLLIDLNFHKPSLHSAFNVSNSFGTSDFLSGGKGIKDVIVPSGFEGLDLITCGTETQTPLKLIDSENLGRLIKWGSENYDMVIIDAPAIEAGSDISVISSFCCSQVILVVASGFLSQENLEITLDTLDKRKIKILGVVLNKFR